MLFIFRLEPVQLLSAREEFKQELALRPPDSLDLSQEKLVQQPNQPQLQFQ